MAEPTGRNLEFDGNSILNSNPGIPEAGTWTNATSNAVGSVAGQAFNGIVANGSQLKTATNNGKTFKYWTLPNGAKATNNTFLQADLMPQNVGDGHTYGIAIRTVESGNSGILALLSKNGNSQNLAFLSLFNGIPHFWDRPGGFNTALNDGTWHYILASVRKTASGYEMLIGADGTDGTVAATGGWTTADASAPFVIGDTNQGGFGYGGDMAIVNEWPRWLSTADRQASYAENANRFGVPNNGGSPPPAANPNAVGEIGDSITEITGVPAAMEARLSALRGATVQPVNQGHSGKTTTDWLPGGSLLPAAATAFVGAGVTVASIELGTNDSKTATLTPVATYISNLINIIDYLYANVPTLLRVVVQMPLTPSPEGASGSTTDEWDASSATRLQAYQTAIAAQSWRTGVSVGNLAGYTALRQAGNVPSDFIHPDGTGVAPAGNAWADSVFAGESATAPTITPAAGTVASGQVVTTAQTQSGGTTRYTIDGSDPTMTSTVYSAPFALNGSGTTATSKTVKARTFAANVYGSQITANTYSVLPPVPVVTTEPSNVSIQSGNTATISASASNAASVKVQRNAGSGWADVAGATASPYTTPQLVTGDDGVQYRFGFTNAGGTTYSDPATITVTATTPPAPIYTGVTILLGQSVVSTATASNPAGGTIDFDNAVQGSNNPSQVVAWTKISGVGTVDSTGLFTYPAATSSPQTAVLRATAADNQHYAEVTVTIPAASVSGTYPAVGNVRAGVQYGAGGNQYNGTLALPAPGQVLQGVGFGADGTQYTGSLAVSATKDYDVDISAVTINKPTFYSAGREILSAQIVATGDDVPGGLLDTPIYLVVDPTLGTVPPTPNSTNSCLAHMRTLNGKVYAQIYIGSTQGGQVLPELPLAGSAAGTPYKLWLLINSVNGEVLWVPSDTFKVY